MTLVTKTLSLQTIGEDHPLPGTLVFHFTFSVLDHLTGKLLSLMPTGNPLASDPLSLGQFSVFSANKGIDIKTKLIMKNLIIRFIIR